MHAQITIIAPGLLGASLGLAARQQRLAARITAWARRPESRLACAESPWCDAAPATLAEAVAGASLVVLCAPVANLAALAAEIGPHLAPGCLVTDVGSTKGQVCRECRAALPPTVRFVGSHPMAGSEKGGMEHAQADLFAHRPCFVTPLPDTPEADVLETVRLWRALEMNVSTVSPETHDEIVAHVSHLPHALASVLSAQLARHDARWAAWSGQGLRDTTRIAGGGAPLWRSIFEQNRDEVLRALDGFERELADFRRSLENREYAQLQHQLERGKAWRDGL